MKAECNLCECHLFRMFDKNILFNVESMLFYEVTPLVYDLVSLLLSGNSDPVKPLKRKYRKAEIENALVYLRKEGFLKNGTSARPEKKPILKKRWGIRHLELMVTHGCNMACRYCYGSQEGEKSWKDAPFSRIRLRPHRACNKIDRFLCTNYGTDEGLIPISQNPRILSSLR